MRRKRAIRQLYSQYRRHCWFRDLAKYQYLTGATVTFTLRGPR